MLNVGLRCYLFTVEHVTWHKPMKSCNFEKGGTIAGWPALVVLFLRETIIEHQSAHNTTNTTSDHHDDVG